MSSTLKRWLVVGNAVILLIVYMLWAFDSLAVINRTLSGTYMKNQMSHMPDERIVIVGIDDMSLEAVGQFPWDRRVYISLLEAMNQPGYEPSSISFDIQFTEFGDPEADQALAESLSQYDNVVMPLFGITEDVVRGVHVTPDQPVQVYDVIKPIFEPFVQTAHINAVLDSDGVIRRTWLQIQDQEGNVYPSLALNAAQMAGVNVSSYIENDYMAGNAHPKGEITIHYSAASNEFITIPAITVLSGEFDPMLFKDAIVLIGFNAVGFENDNGSTPIEREMKLVYAHANIINQLINGYVSTTAPWSAVLAILAAAFALIVWLAWRIKTTYSVAVFALLIGALFLGQYAVYAQTFMYIDVVHPVIAVVMTYILNIAVKSYLENKQKSFITKQFGRYLSPELVKEIAVSNTEIKLGGMNKVLTILFLDIRGFTTLSEKLRPEEVVDFLNEMFDLITTTALNNKGTIDKFIGDAAMIIYNAPLDVEDHPYWAVKTAYEIQQGMKEVRTRIEERHGVTVNCGIGINTGEVVVGNIGSYLRVDYTAIGDNVNTAARIESQTAAGQILVSESTYELTKDRVVYNYVGEKMMKGKTVGVNIYEVLGIAE